MIRVKCNRNKTLMELYKQLKEESVATKGAEVFYVRDIQKPSPTGDMIQLNVTHNSLTMMLEIVLDETKTYFEFTTNVKTKYGKWVGQIVAWLFELCFRFGLFTKTELSW